ncbi:MAG: class I SAM-dependent methyltransferase [Xanthomonadales bacterium]|nr:class I SAM-dependent methyltransferase [Xanthomonadales bacterium]
MAKGPTIAIPGTATSDVSSLGESLRPTDVGDAHYRAFRDAIVSGASRQDIYTGTEHGYAARAWAQSSDPAQVAERDLDTRREFDRIRAHMDNLVEPLRRHYGLEGMSVLEVGCGTGALAVALGLAGAVVTAVDPTASSLAACRHRAAYFGLPLERLRLLHVQPEPGLMFADRQFDRVVVNSVLEFIPERRAEHVRDWVRVLRRDGLLVISAENGWFPRDYYSGMLLPRLRRRTCIATNRPFGPTWRELRCWAAASGRMIDDLSVENRFNSIDKLAARVHARGHRRLGGVLRTANRWLKQCCSRIGVPADVLLPYATSVFRVKD